MADGHGEGTDWEGPYDPLLMQDDFDDVMYLLDIPAVVLDPAPLALAAQAQNVTAGPPGDNLPDPEWPAKLNNDSVDSRAPTHNAAIAGDLPRSTQYVGAGTSATASASSSPHDENALLDCTGCHVLREVLHSNGLEAAKLRVHGAAGLFYHATLEVYRINSEGLATALTHQSYIDFRGQDYVWVKHYLTDYAQQRAGAGYTVVHDSISAFHDALCVGMNYGGNADGDDRREGMQMAAAAGNGGGSDQQQELAGATDDAAQSLIDQGNVPAAAGPSEPSASNEQEQREVRQVGRSALAIQRERASNLQLGDLARYFHLPMTQAARHLGVCATVLKTTSRRFHVPRWPHRKIKSIDNHIAKLRRTGDNGGAAAKREMERLTESRRKIYADLLGQ
ncbi:hypothetical protein GQ55_3G060400 [Panicum hallii var. hallii]|uniref:RWP-RK domain-containing protein n=1 Tax=Panicum hallii var. hallii TaxID=1504633 RepID=A0A2T7E684_9POAL|nr:hypothetical protein GQ55_3G060400 [Panicum hallii var. hallii]